MRYLTIIFLFLATFATGQQALFLRRTPPTTSTQFISEWVTTNTSTGSSASNQVKLPLIATGTYNFTVYWGDGSSDVITAYDQAEVTHTYSSSGTYELTIDGTIEGFRFANSGDRLKIADISQWGNLKIGTNQGQYFYGCSNLVISANDILNVSEVTSMAEIFRGCSSLTSPDVSGWDVSNVTNMFYAFTVCSSLTSLDLSGWDVSNVTTMEQMFGFSSNLTNIGDVSGWDVSNVTNMFRFITSANITNFDPSGWNVSNVTNFNNFISSAALPTAIYDQLLINWNALPPKSGVTAVFGVSKYTTGGAAEAARTSLINTYGWTITDGGGI